MWRQHSLKSEPMTWLLSCYWQEFVGGTWAMRTCCMKRDFAHVLKFLNHTNIYIPLKWRYSQEKNVSCIYDFGWKHMTFADAGFEFDICYTSVLKRAIRTLWIVLDSIDQMWLPVHRTWRLNERHYGGLTGLNKAETAARHGEAQVKIWRRSYDVPPPVMDADHDFYYVISKVWQL